MLTSSTEALTDSAVAAAAELIHVGAVPAETGRRLACDASVSEVEKLDGVPLNVGRSRRTIPAALRRALVMRDRHCRFPGCDRPPEWTDGHHIRHWADGGETSLENLVLLCRVHHRRVHEERWQLVRGDDGELVAQPP